MVECEIWDLTLIPVYTKNQLVSWSNDKVLSSRTDVINRNSLLKKTWWEVIFVRWNIWLYRNKSRAKINEHVISVVGIIVND